MYITAGLYVYATDRYRLDRLRSELTEAVKCDALARYFAAGDFTQVEGRRAQLESIV